MLAYTSSLAESSLPFCSQSQRCYVASTIFAAVTTPFSYRQLLHTVPIVFQSTLIVGITERPLPYSSWGPCSTTIGTRSSIATSRHSCYRKRSKMPTRLSARRHLLQTRSSCIQLECQFSIDGQRSHQVETTPHTERFLGHYSWL